ncbi:MAG: cation-translocating P-type ATPase [Lunatimonas sp.]|uniref:cation-translocating P-type ATPase n=1 Tax=Lunatimonas sp. TaxID=2060141 RepID=UPI00263A96F8|nr:cation-translocating P-type ATPase [Lunatimonas sp.]MCC5939782.1 cation-translocating P-type ATPase [Lunatimonas sp.]
MHYHGLHVEEVIASRQQFGANSIQEQSGTFWKVLLEVVREPLFLLLVAAALIYFSVGEYTEGIVMLVALGLVSGISLFQENKSRNAVEALKSLTSSAAQVYREGILVALDPKELVVGDFVVLEDGDLVPADGALVESYDFLVNESMLTGESLALPKTSTSDDSKVFQGSLVVGGTAVFKVESVGKNTKLGSIGRSLEQIEEPKTPLQVQIRGFVRMMVVFGAGAFVLVCLVNFLTFGDFLAALLHGLTLAMSVLPEEIPVAFSTFMALGAYRLYKMRVIARSPYTVETLGASTVICIDKTGTLTENRMELRQIYEFSSGKLIEYAEEKAVFSEVLAYGMWASEILPFDAMEKSIHTYYGKLCATDERPGAQMLHEYPLGGKPPMMTHVFQVGEGKRIVAVKGSLEGILNQSRLSDTDLLGIQEVAGRLLGQGYRLLGVGRGIDARAELPATQFEFEYDFLGILAFYDPPKVNIRGVLRQFYQAGIQVKMITGDHATTAIALADQVGLRHGDEFLTGVAVDDLSIEELKQRVSKVQVFARMYPEAKLKVIEALKANGEVVAMTGDGVNDGPALKAAHIGIAMGQRGSEIAKKSAALVLADDDLGHMPVAVALGRRIYENLKKAIRYIISIHIPIILIVLMPLLLGWEFVHIFTPIHVIFLELIMGPTCSIVFEREPIEPGSMDRPPRKVRESFFSIRELSVSLIQGLLITAACLGWGYYAIQEGLDEASVRTLVFAALVFSNVFLTLVNRSFYHSVWTTLKYKNPLIPLILGVSLLVLGLSLTVSPVRSVFGFEEVSLWQVAGSAIVGLLGVIWLEGYKYWRRRGVSTRDMGGPSKSMEY